MRIQFSSAKRKHPLVRLNYEDSTIKGTKDVSSSQIPTENNTAVRPSTSTSPSSQNTEARPLRTIKQKPSQAKLPFMPKTINIHTKSKLDKCLMDIFTKDMQPFTIVEDQGFRNFVQMLNPSYQLPSRKYVSNTLLPAIYEEK
ncbi:unnamed protein product [Psylliodes chrysocephalus]|uniref:Uncharacterized protein n=1 Tax=Psylliodes chrysocephalus TaxID=3402493 RepID=A0A9P0DAG1_9CUCU|nr:unnamed protein product [Psylliodes chrysocephala]